MQGVDWTRVREIVDCTVELRELVAPPGGEDYFTWDALCPVDSTGMLNLGTSPHPNVESETQRCCFKLPVP
jgi:hypothetical protein